MMEGTQEHTYAKAHKPNSSLFQKTTQKPPSRYDSTMYTRTITSIALAFAALCCAYPAMITVQAFAPHPITRSKVGGTPEMALSSTLLSLLPLKTRDEKTTTIQQHTDTGRMFSHSLSEDGSFLAQDDMANASSLKQIESLQKREVKVPETLSVALWMGLVSVFVVLNNFAGPFPTNLADGTAVPTVVWGLMHGLAGMLFGGGIVTTTCLEWLAVSSRNEEVLKF